MGRECVFLISVHVFSLNLVGFLKVPFWQFKTMARFQTMREAKLKKFQSKIHFVKYNFNRIPIPSKDAHVAGDHPSLRCFVL